MSAHQKQAEAVGDHNTATELRQRALTELAPPTSSFGAVTVSRKGSLNQIAGLNPFYFMVGLAVVLTAGYLNIMPESMLSGFAITMFVGGFLMWLGNLIPGIRDFGLPTILCTFGPATLVFLGLFPENLTSVVQLFLKEWGYLDFFVIAVIVGSVLGMPRELLIKAGPRFLAPLIGCLAITFLVIFLVGGLTGFGGLEAVLFIAAPVMAGGLGIGAAPMSEMYARQTGGSSADFMGDLMSAVVVANIFCIIFAGVYNGMGRMKKELFVGFNGHGQLLRIEGNRDELTMPPKATGSTFVLLGKGLALTAALFVTGEALGAYLTFLHPYAWSILCALFAKVFRLFPQDLEDSASGWSDFITAALVPSLLVSVSLTYISIDEVLASLTNPAFITLTVLTVLIAGLSSGLIGWLVKMNFVEASITPGLVLADTGGSGDVSVLSAANRLHLMPFAALTNRIGGVLVLFVTSLLTSLL